MNGFGNTIENVLREVVGACQTPVIIMLLLAAATTLVCLGWLIAEAFLEHRHFKVFLPQLVDDLREASYGTGEDVREVIRQSGLLLRQKQYLIELTRHEDAGDQMRESLAVSLEEQEREHYATRVQITDLLSRISPMLGLLGTLIPLGPGLVALGSGDTETLSSALRIAFDTTSLGLLVAALALIISAIRKRWYRNYMNAFDTAIDCVLEAERSLTHDDAKADGAKPAKSSTIPYNKGSHVAATTTVPRTQLAGGSV